MPEHGPVTVTPSEAAQSLRTVFDMLLQDKALHPLDPATLPWQAPILVLRSAPIERLQAFFHELVAYCRAPILHVMSHARDEDAIRAVAPCDLMFHTYPGPGRYRLEDVPAEMLSGLRAVGFGTVFFLDAGTSGDLLVDVERLAAAIAENRTVSFRGNGTYAWTPDWRQRTLAEAAFLRLVEWYHFKLDPGFPDGPVRPADANTPLSP
jgi:hypothetical protein